MVQDHPAGGGILALRPVALFVLLLFWSAGALAQPAERSTVHREAERLRNEGAFAAAATLLEGHYAQDPNDSRAVRLLAQTRYWMGERAEAQALYAAAVLRHPRDPGIRYDYARMLAETGERQRARHLAGPLIEIPDWEPEALALLGTIAYWEGDLTTAMRMFRAALRLQPAHEESRRQLLEIRRATAGWLKLTATDWHDDQPLDRRSFSSEAGWFATPLTPVLVRLEPVRYASAPGATSMLVAGVEVAHYIPAARLDLRTQARRVPLGGSRTEWASVVTASLRLNHGVTPRVRLERSEYLRTAASLLTPVTYTGVSSGVGVQHARGWLADSEFLSRRFFDGNTGWSAYGWLLAPLVHRRDVSLRAGYAFSASDTREVRFSAGGRYDPYHTPLDQRTHAALAALNWTGPRRQGVDLNANIGFRARETAPWLTGLIEPVLALEERQFRPRTFRGRVSIPATRSFVVEATAEYGRGAFYSWRAFSLGGTYRFTVPGTNDGG